MIYVTYIRSMSVGHLDHVLIGSMEHVTWKSETLSLGNIFFSCVK